MVEKACIRCSSGCLFSCVFVSCFCEFIGVYTTKGLYMCVYMYVCIDVYVMCMYTCMHTYSRILRICVCRTCMYIHLRICMHICMYVCMYVYAYIFIQGTAVSLFAYNRANFTTVSSSLLMTCLCAHMHVCIAKFSIRKNISMIFMVPLTSTTHIYSNKYIIIPIR
jgi:hypothetical protein